MKYIFSVLGMILFGIIAMILFTRSTDTGQNTQTGNEAVSTVNFVNDQSRVEYTKNGNIVAEEDYRTLRITVSEKERTIEVLKGYNQAVETRKTYGNDYESYNVFMRALDVAGFTRSKESKVTDPVGTCPKGYRYEYKLKQLSDDVSNLWNNSCQVLNGTLANNGSAIRDLFQKQIPDYEEVVKGVDF